MAPVLGLARVLRFEVTTQPVAKARPRLALRHGRAHAYTPAKTQEAEWRIRTAFQERFPGHQPAAGPVELQVIVWLRMPASTPKKHRLTAQPVTRPDVDNYLKTVLDALNGVAFLDDSQVVEAICRKRYVGDTESPGWAISLILPESRQASQPPIPAQEQAHGSTSARLRRAVG